MEAWGEALVELARGGYAPLRQLWWCALDPSGLKSLRMTPEQRIEAIRRRDLWHDLIGFDRGSLMLLGAAKTLSLIFSVVLITPTFAQALCPVDDVMVRGRVDHAPRNTRVRVQLMYSRDIPGESGDVTFEDGRFSIPVEFLTQSRRPVVDGKLGKCGRSPKTVIVTLVDQDHEYDRVTLDFAKDFKMTGSSGYIVRSEVVLDGSR